MDDPLTEKTLAREGCSLHYWVSETPGKPWLMLLHGAGADHNMFNDQYPILAGKYSLIAMDTRGAGQSRPMGSNLTIALMVEDALAVLDCEGVKKAALIGQSLGGNIAQEIVYRHPERVESVVFIDCTCNTMKLTPMERFAVWCSPVLFAVYPSKSLISQSAAASAIKPEVRQYLKKVLGTVGKKGFISIMGVGTKGCLHYDENHRIGKPMLLVCGESDGTGNIRKCAPKWAAREPKCEFHMIQHAGHCSNMDNPDAVNGLLADFLHRQYTA